MARQGRYTGLQRVADGGVPAGDPGAGNAHTPRRANLGGYRGTRAETVAANEGRRMMAGPGGDVS